MGLLTVLVEHDWSMTSSSYRKAHDTTSRKPTTSHLQKISLNPAIPSSIDKFLTHSFHSQITLTTVEKFTHLFTVLSRLSCSYSIRDSYRIDTSANHVIGKKKKDPIDSIEIQKIKQSEIKNHTIFTNDILNSIPAFKTTNILGEPSGIIHIKHPKKPYLENSQINVQRISTKTRHGVLRSLIILATKFPPQEEIHERELLDFGTRGTDDKPKTTGKSVRFNETKPNTISPDLMFTVIRLKALDILIESLDTGILYYDAGEVEVLVDLFMKFMDCFLVYHEHCFRMQDDGGFFEEVLNEKMVMDQFTEKSISCMYLITQRLEYIIGVDPYSISIQQIQILNTISNSLLTFSNFTTTFIHEHFLIRSILNSITSISVPKANQTENLAEPIVLSLLSKVLRMQVFEGFLDMVDSFVDILGDLQDRHEWAIGCNFIKILGAASIKNIKVLEMFITVLPRITEFHPDWIYQGITCLATIVLSGETQKIKKLALDSGILRFINHSLPHIKTACIISLVEIHRHHKDTPVGAVCIEAISSCESDSKYTRIQTGQIQILGDIKNTRRITHLFKYIAFKLAEHYIESQNWSSFLQRYLKSAVTPENKPQKKFRERVEKDWEKMKTIILQQHALKYPNTRIEEQSQLDELKTKMMKQKSESSMSSVSSPASDDEIIVLPAKLHYHQNYEYLNLIKEKSDNLFETPQLDSMKESQNTGQLKISILGVDPYHQKTALATPGYQIRVKEPDKGTINRRKLFDCKIGNVKEVRESPARKRVAGLKFPRING